MPYAEIAAAIVIVYVLTICLCVAGARTDQRTEAYAARVWLAKELACEASDETAGGAMSCAGDALAGAGAGGEPAIPP